MPRTSKKHEALAAAYRIVETDGIAAVTYDRLSEATGMSKSGLIYHFPSRHELLLEMHRHMAAEWEADIISRAGDTPAEELSPRERYRAALATMSQNGPLAELLMNLQAHSHPDFQAVWDELDGRWLPDPADPATDPDLLAASVLGAGLWVHDHISARPLTPAAREQLIARIMDLLAEPY